MKQLVIIYDPATAQDGEPIDLFAYLLNELGNAGIDARLYEVDATATESVE